MATALCRLLWRRGVRVAPFKAQNMSNNSFPCEGGGEIGRSQVAQAEACGLKPEPSMNPVLLKPSGDSVSQVIVHGRVWKTLHAREYYQHTAALRAEALRAFQDLAGRFDVIVMEGAGSVAELNLLDRDFVNLSMAREVGAHAMLVADIERGGVFGSVLGTLSVLPEELRVLIRTFAVNRFRGDPALFAEGVRILEERSGLPCLGVFPFAEGIHLDAEDSLAPSGANPAASDVAILRFPRISNTTDFRLLVDAVWLDRPDTRRYRAVILPGTKSTLGDLAWMRKVGLDRWLLDQHRQGARVVGICGGYQMLGEWIDDPEGVDGTPGHFPGLGLLPVRTRMEAEKTTRTRRATTPAGVAFDAYEIHMGRTERPDTAVPLATLEDGITEGIRYGGVIGTYLHGALESAAMAEEMLGSTTGTPVDKTQSYDALADWLEANASRNVLEGLIGI